MARAAAYLNRPRARVRSFGFAIPGAPIPLAGLDLTEAERKRLGPLQQTFTHAASTDSTALGVQAAREALSRAGVGAGDVSLVISAPSLLAAHGFEIPSVRVRAALGLTDAQCLNVSQGCVGVLRAVQLAQQHFQVEGPRARDVLIVTTCGASALTERHTHGSFFWGDGAAALVLTAQPGEGLTFAGYAECSAEEDIDAMNVPCGDAPAHQFGGGDPRRIQVNFADGAAQTRYIRGERVRFGKVIEGLAQQVGGRVDDFDAVFVPSTGANRVSTLFGDHRNLEARLATDFSFPHTGGVDVMLFLDSHVRRQRPKDGGLFATLSPAFTAQWGGVAWRYDRMPEGLAT